MGESIEVGDCVHIPDGRIGRVREVMGPHCRVRVRRTTSEIHQFLKFIADDLERVDCPKGWMSTEGYVRYLDTTLAKMRKREAKGRRKGQQDTLGELYDVLLVVMGSPERQEMHRRSFRASYKKKTT